MGTVRERLKKLMNALKLELERKRRERQGQGLSSTEGNKGVFGEKNQGRDGGRNAVSSTQNTSLTLKTNYFRRGDVEKRELAERMEEMKREEEEKQAKIMKKMAEKQQTSKKTYSNKLLEHLKGVDDNKGGNRETQGVLVPDAGSENSGKKKRKFNEAEGIEENMKERITTIKEINEEDLQG